MAKRVYSKRLNAYLNFPDDWSDEKIAETEAHEWAKRQSALMEKDIPLGGVGAFLQGIGRGVANAVIGIPEGIGGVTGSETIQNIGRGMRESDLGRMLTEPPPESIAQYPKLSQAGELTGNVLTYLTPGAVLKAPRVATTALAMTQGAAEQAREADRMGATPGERQLASILGAATGTLDAVVPGRITAGLRGLNAANAAANQGIAGVLRRGAGTALLGSGTESAQTLAQNKIEQMVYNPDQDLTEGLLNSAIAGGGVEGGLEVALQLLAGKAGRSVVGKRARMNASPEVSRTDRNAVGVRSGEGGDPIVEYLPQTVPEFIARSPEQHSQLFAERMQRGASTQAPFEAPLDVDYETVRSAYGLPQRPKPDSDFLLRMQRMASSTPESPIDVDVSDAQMRAAYGLPPRAATPDPYTFTGASREEAPAPRPTGRVKQVAVQPAEDLLNEIPTEVPQPAITDLAGITSGTPVDIGNLTSTTDTPEYAPIGRQRQAPTQPMRPDAMSMPAPVSEGGTAAVDPSIPFTSPLPQKLSMAAPQPTAPQYTIAGMREELNAGKTPELAMDLHRALKGLGVDDLISTRLVDSMANPAADGQFSAADRVIELGLLSKDKDAILRTLDHEAVHAMKTMGLFTDMEWSILERAFDPKAILDEQERKFYTDYYKGDVAAVKEEAIARGMEKYGRGKIQLAPEIQSVVDRKLTALDRIGNVFRDQQVEAPKQVMDRFASGEIGARNVDVTNVNQPRTVEEPRPTQDPTANRSTELEDYDTEAKDGVGAEEGEVGKLSTRKEKNVDAFRKWLSDAGIDHSVRGSSWASQYIEIDMPDGSIKTIRFSDHAPRVDGSGNPVGGFNQELQGRHDAADLSIHPSGPTLASAKDFVRNQFSASDWDNVSANLKKSQAANTKEEARKLDYRIDNLKRVIQAEKQSSKPYQPHIDQMQRDLDSAKVRREKLQPKLSVKPLWEMGRNEIEDRYQKSRQEDKTLLVDLFGDKAEQYRKLERISEGSSDRADAAYAELEKMQSSLSQEQRNRLFGIGEGQPSTETIGSFRDALISIDATSPQNLADSIDMSILRLRGERDVSKMDHAQKMAYAQLRYAFEEANKKGWDTAEISNRAAKRLASRLSRSDVDMVLGQFKKDQPRLSVKQLPVPNSPYAAHDDRTKLRKAADSVFKAKWTELADAFRQQVIDMRHGIVEAGKKAGFTKTEQSAEFMTRQYDRASELAAAMAKYGPGQLVGKIGDGHFEVMDKPELAWGNIMKEAHDKGKADHLVHYLTGERGAWLYADGRENKLTPQEIADFKALGKDPEVKAWADRYYKFNDANIDMLVASQVIDKQLGDKWKSSKYIPFYRVTPDGEVTFARSGESMATAPRIKGLKGGKGDLNDFVENIVHNTTMLTQMATKNAAKHRIVRDGLNTGMIVDGKNTTAVVPTYKGEAGKTMKVFINGKEKHFKVNDPLLMKSLEASMLPYDIATKVGAMPAQFLRNMITHSPVFAIRNALRDSATAWAMGYINAPYVNIAGGLRDAIKQAPNFQKLERMGVLGTGIRGEGGAVGTASNIYKDIRRKHSWWDTLQDITSKSEAVSRLTIYDAVKKRGGSDAEAAYQAQEFLNFQRRGGNKYVQMLNALIPFQNARFQGADVFYRAMRGKGPMPVSMQKQLLWRAGWLTAIGAAQAALLHDDESYQNMSQDVKDNNLTVPVGNGELFKLPIPFEIGVFKIIGEHAVNMYNGTTDGRDFLKAMKSYIQDTMHVDIIPQALKPMYETSNNYDRFRQRQIEPEYMKRTEPGLRSDADTSELAKALGKYLDWSPMKIDHWIKGYTGTIGMYTNSLISHLVNENPSEIFDDLFAGKAHDMPLVGAMFQGPNGPRNLIDFYEINSVAEQAANAIKAGAERTDKRLKLAAAERRLQPIETQIRELTSQEKKIRANKALKRAQKIAALEEVRRRKILLAAPAQQVKRSVQ